MGCDVRKPVFVRWFANNKGADQPAHLRSLISPFVNRFLESSIWKLATGEISFFYVVSVAEETVLNLALTETPKTGFLAKRPKSNLKLKLFRSSGGEEQKSRQKPEF